MATTKRKRPTKAKAPAAVSSHVRFQIDRATAAKIAKCIKKGELRVSLDKAKVTITPEGVLVSSYLWD